MLVELAANREVGLGIQAIGNDPSPYTDGTILPFGYGGLYRDFCPRWMTVHNGQVFLFEVRFSMAQLVFQETICLSIFGEDQHPTGISIQSMREFNSFPRALVSDQSNDPPFPSITGWMNQQSGWLVDHH